MRAPHTIPQHVLKAYASSNQTKSLNNEFRRELRADDWEYHKLKIPSLKQLSIQTMVNNFGVRTPLNSLAKEDFHLFLEALPPTVPLEITVPLVPDGVYWKRCAENTWNSMNVVNDYGGSWRRLVVERRLQEELEKASPSGLEDAIAMSRLVGHLVRRLRVRRLFTISMSNSSVPEVPSAEYSELPIVDMDLIAMEMDMFNIFGNLVHLEDVDIMFGQQDFHKNLNTPPTILATTISRAIGRALPTLKTLRRLKIHRSQLHIERLNLLLEPLLSSAMLTELNLSNSHLGDKGVHIVTTFIANHSSLTVLRLANSKFGTRGATYLANSLLQKSCAPLLILDVSLNSLGDVGGHNLMMALVPREHRQPLRETTEDEEVRALILAEQREEQERLLLEQLRLQELQKEREQRLGEGTTIFRSLVERALASSDIDAAESEWVVEGEPIRRQSAILANVVEEARTFKIETEERERVHQEEEKAKQEASVKAAEIWDGAPERLREFFVDGCRLGSAAGLAAALLLQTNRALSTLTISNNNFGEDSCSALAQALEDNPRILYLDMRMCGARWEEQVVIERALRSNNALLREPLRLHQQLREREDECRARMVAKTEVLGMRWAGEPSLKRPTVETTSTVTETSVAGPSQDNSSLQSVLHE